MSLLNLHVILAPLARRVEGISAYHSHHFPALGWIGAVALPLAAFVEELVGPPLFDTVWIRLFCGIFALPFLFFDRLPEKVKDNVDYIWVVSVGMCPCFCFGFILTANAYLTPEGHDLNPIWVYQYLAGLFIFVLLMGNWLICILVWLLVTAPFIVFGLSVEFPEPSALVEAWILPAPVYLSAVIVGALSSRNSEIINEERLRTASRLGGYIAHELRTPLASTTLICRALLKSLSPRKPNDTFIARTPWGPGEQEIRVEVAKAVAAIQEEVRYSNTIIDILLRNVAPIRKQQAWSDIFLMSEVLSEATRRFPFSGARERALLSIFVLQDFYVQGNFELTVNVALNLFRNALYFCQSRRGGEVRVICGRSSGYLSLIVTDSGSGISESDRRRVFDLFFSRSPSGQGAGIGLSFCKSVMEGLGGQILCESKEGEYTTFRLLFPHPKSETSAPHSG